MTVLWLRFLPRWSLAVGLATLALLLVFLFGVGQKTADTALGAGHLELLQAVRTPGMFRLGWTLDSLIWIMLGVSLVALGGMLRLQAPIQAAFITISGVAQLFGVLGGFLRLDGIGDLAALYRTAAPDQQAALLEANLQLGRIVISSSQIGVVLQGVGYLLAAWGVFSLAGFPRWLAAWLILPGLLAVAQFLVFAAGAPVLRALNYIGVTAGNIGLNFALALALWRPPPKLVSSVAGEQTR